MKVRKLSAEALEEEIQVKDRISVIDFYADWCGPCKMLAPLMEELADEMEDVFFGKVNVDEEETAARKYGITSVPGILIFCGGKKLSSSVGFAGKEPLVAAIREAQTQQAGIR